MSVTINVIGGLERPTPKLLTTTNQTDVYTAPADQRVALAKLLVASSGVVAHQVDIHYYKSSDTTNYLIWADQIPAAGSAQPELEIAMREGDKIKATAALANVITVTPIIVDQSAYAPAVSGSVG